MFDRLTNQHAVEGIAVDRGEFRQVRQGRFVKGERVDPVPVALTGDIGERLFRQREPAELMFHEDLPKRDNAQAHFVRR